LRSRLNSLVSSVAWRSPASSRTGVEAPQVSSTPRAGPPPSRAARDRRPQPSRRRCPCTWPMAIRAQPGADEQHRRRVEVRDRGTARRPRPRGPARSRSDGVMTGCQPPLDRAEELGEEAIVVEADACAERLTPIWGSRPGTLGRTSSRRAERRARRRPRRRRARRAESRAPTTTASHGRAPLEVGDGRTPRGPPRRRRAPPARRSRGRTSGRSAGGKRPSASLEECQNAGSVMA